MDIKKFEEMLEQCKAVAKLLGATEEQAIKTAIERAKTELGEDYIGLIKTDGGDHEVGPSRKKIKDPNFLAPRGIAKELDIGCHVPNIILCHLGCQKERRGGKYTATDMVVHGRDYIKDGSIIMWNLDFFKEAMKKYVSGSGVPYNGEFLMFSEIDIKISNGANLSTSALIFAMHLKGYLVPGAYIRRRGNKNYSRWLPSKRAICGIDYKKSISDSGKGALRWNEGLVRSVCKEFLSKAKEAVNEY
jgi:hypothetical protein